MDCPIAFIILNLHNFFPFLRVFSTLNKLLFLRILDDGNLFLSFFLSSSKRSYPEDLLTITYNVTINFYFKKLTKKHVNIKIYYTALLPLIRHTPFLFKGLVDVHPRDIHGDGKIFTFSYPLTLGIQV